MNACRLPHPRSPALLILPSVVTLARTFVTEGRTIRVRISFPERRGFREVRGAFFMAVA